MTRTKDPAAHQASARRAVVEEESWETPEQIDLPLLPPHEGNAGVPILERGSGCVPKVEGRKWATENASSSREERPVRRKRLRSPISIIAIKRVLKAADTAGLSVDALEVRPDGTIVLTTGSGAAGIAEDVFATWADRL